MCVCIHVYVYIYVCVSYFKAFFYDLCVSSIFLNHPTLLFYANSIDDYYCYFDH